MDEQNKIDPAAAGQDLNAMSDGAAVAAPEQDPKPADAADGTAQNEPPKDPVIPPQGQASGMGQTPGNATGTVYYQPPKRQAPTWYAPAPNPAPNPQPAQAKKSAISWATVLVCLALCIGTALLCGVMMLISILSQPEDGGKTIIYENTTVVENTGAVITDEQTVEAVNRCKDSVVEIETALSKTSYESESLLGSGSGVVWSTGDFSYIVTNNHVVDGGSYFMITFPDGEQVEGTLVGTDLYADLAVLKIKKSGLTAIKPSTNAEIKEGMTVLAIGNPLGELGGSKTFGKISTSARDVEIEGITMTLIQHDAAVNSGNSGGGLFDVQGRLVGIVNAKYSGNGVYGLNFAIPIDTVKDVADQLIEQGYVSGRPQLGVTILSYNADYPYSKAEYEATYPGISTHLVHSGLYVVSVDAQKAFKFGDCIYEMDGVDITSMDDVRQVLATHQAGDVIQVKVLRDGYLQKVGPYEQYMYMDTIFDFTLTQRTA